MILSIYKELLQYEEVGGDMIERIKKISVYDIFKPLAEKFEGELFNKILFYILHVYSKESNKDFLGSDLKTRKLTIAKELKLPKEYTELTDYSIRQTIINYLEFQDYRTYKHLIVLREQYEEMLGASIEKLMKGKGEDSAVDYDMKYKCGDFADKLLDRIKFYEDKLKDDNTEISDLIKEVEKVNKKRVGTTLSVDSNEYIKD